MDVPEKFTVYRVQENMTRNWLDINKVKYENYKRRGFTVQKLAILPEYTIYAKSIYRANHGGTYHKVEIFQDNKVIYTSTLQHDHWGDIALRWLVSQGLIKVPDGQSRQSTLFIREELNIDYVVEEVKRLKDL